MISVFVDTSALLPLIDRRNVAHEIVLAAFEQLSANDARLVTSNYVLVEAGALVRKRLGAEAFRSLGEVATRGLDIVWIEADDHFQAWEMAVEEPRNGPGLVDWSSFLLMRRQRIEKALALDRHFLEQGFETLPELPAAS